MVMDLKNSGFKLFDKALEYLNTHPEFCKVWDQSAMNYAANGRFRILEDFLIFKILAIISVLLNLSNL